MCVDHLRNRATREGHFCPIFVTRSHWLTVNAQECVIVGKWNRDAYSQPLLPGKAPIPLAERNRVTIIAFLNETNSTITEMKVFPRVDFVGSRIYLRRENHWLKSGIRLESISDLLSVLGCVNGPSSSPS